MKNTIYILLIITAICYLKFGTADHWQGKTFHQIFLGRTQHQQDSVYNIYFAKENAKYKFKIGQKVKILTITGVVTGRGDERLVGFFPLPVMDGKIFYEVFYTDMEGRVRKQIFTESELQLF